MNRISKSFYNLVDNISCIFRPPSVSKYGRELPVIKGNMQRVIVVKPNNDIFREAVFIINDSYFNSPGISRKELLRQAEDAALSYVDELCPPERRSVLPLIRVILLLLAVTVMLLHFLEVI